jgi:hypothetical protein
VVSPLSRLWRRLAQALERLRGSAPSRQATASACVGTADPQQRNPRNVLTKKCSWAALAAGQPVAVVLGTIPDTPRSPVLRACASLGGFSRSNPTLVAGDVVASVPPLPSPAALVALGLEGASRLTALAPPPKKDAIEGWPPALEGWLA